MKVLFIQAKQKKHDRFLVHPPYGLLYLASVLRKNNFDVKIYDANISRLANSKEYAQEICGIISEWKPDCLGIGGMVSSFLFVKEVTLIIKKRFPHLPIVGGGLFVSAVPELAIKNTDIDIGCIGEAEEIIVDLFNKVYTKEPLEGIDGLVLKTGGNVTVTGQKELLRGRRPRKLKDLDWIPLPSYDLIDLKRYLPYQAFCGDLLKKFLKKQGKNSRSLSGISPYAMPVFTGRGCPFNCIFCFSTMDKNYIKHSVAYVISHLEYLQANYGLNHFQLLDENFNIDKRWVVEFCTTIIKRKKNYYFTTGNRNRVGFFDKEMLTLMREANFYDVSVGVESLDDVSLKEMNRRLSSAEIIETLGLIKEAGIEQEHIRCLCGFPSDTKEAIFGSIKKGNELGYKTLFALVMPLPGTELYRYCLKNRIITDEAAYLEELYTKDGYRNMTKFKSLKEVTNIINQANAFSELDYLVRRRQWLRYFKAFVVLNIVKKIVHLFRLTGAKNRLRELILSAKAR